MVLAGAMGPVFFGGGRPVNLFPLLTSLNGFGASIDECWALDSYEIESDEWELCCSVVCCQVLNCIA
jgi:hypothetical protein